MGKKQHQSDKLYISQREHKARGGHKKAVERKLKRLPFSHCALTLSPFETPVCTADCGIPMDILEAVPFLKKHKKHPLTGKPCDPSQLIPMKFSRNQDGKYCCPVTSKIFTEHSHIVCIATTGNVFAGDAVQRLNAKLGNWTDLSSGKAFEKKDILTVQAAGTLTGGAGAAAAAVASAAAAAAAAAATGGPDSRNIDTFFYVKAGLLKDGKAGSGAKGTGGSANVRLSAVSSGTKRIYEELQKRAAKRPRTSGVLGTAKSVRTLSAVGGTGGAKSRYTSGHVSASFTSTSMSVSTQNQLAAASKAERDERRWLRTRKLKKKGYAKICTTHGDMVLELHFDMAPRTCENFALLAAEGYYDGESLALRWEGEVWLCLEACVS